MDIKYSDIVSMGLLYSYIYSKTEQRMVSEYSMKKFCNCIVDNLSLKKIKVNVVYMDSLEKCNFIVTRDEIGKYFYVLKSGINLDEEVKRFIGNMPSCIVSSSLMNNALSCLGLVCKNKSVMPIRDFNTDTYEEAKIRKFII